MRQSQADQSPPFPTIIEEQDPPDLANHIQQVG
jgi:hypothetical protein